MGLDSAYGIGSLKPGVCTSSTKPAVPFEGQVIYMTDVDQTAVWDGTQWVGTSPTGGRNILVNGGFDVWQRGTPITGVNNSPSYSADRWVIFRSLAANYTLTRTAMVPSELSGFNYSARYQRTAGDTSVAIMYFGRTFESISVIPLAGKTVTLSFYARKGANYSGGVLDTQIEFGTGTDTGFLTQPTSASVTNMSSTLTTSWQRFSQSVSVASTATAARIFWDYTPTGTAGANDYFEITGVQLEVGAVATPFESEDYGTTLAKCQRYYIRLTGEAAFSFMGSGIAYNSTLTVTSTVLPVKMRKVPTVVEFLSIRATNVNTTFAITAVTLDGNFENSYQPVIDSTTTGLTTGNFYFIGSNATTNSYLAFGAEL